MSAIGRDIAKAIVEDCNAASWSQAVQFESSYLPRETLEGAADVSVVVMYAGQRAVPDSRAAWRHEYDIDVGVRKRLATDGNTEADYYSDLLDAIGDFWKTRSPGSTSARLIGVEWLNPYVPEHMTEHKTFTGVIRLTFRLVRAN